MEDIILCACGCGDQVKKARYPSQQARYINTHQHKGSSNGNFRGGKINFACPVCGDSFLDWPSQKPVTCGKDDCYRKWQGMTSAARGNHKLTFTCMHCGKNRSLYPSQIGPTRMYCSNSCRVAAHTEIYRGPKGKNWKGGKEAYARKTTRERDGHACVVCGFNLVVDVHHITERASGGTNDPSNLLTLCPNHHRLAHLGVIDLESYRRASH